MLFNLVRPTTCCTLWTHPDALGTCLNAYEMREKCACEMALKCGIFQFCTHQVRQKACKRYKDGRAEMCGAKMTVPDNTKVYYVQLNGRTRKDPWGVTPRA